MRFALAAVLCGLFLAAGGPAKAQSPWLVNWRKTNKVWRGIHVFASNDADLTAISSKLPAFTRAGVNVIVVEIDYAFQFKSRPEMFATGGITKAGARRFETRCRAVGVRPIPEVNCLGHQSWIDNTGALLKIHPELDETPGLYPNNAGIYCRSWCPRHAGLQPVLFPMLDEIADAFEADAFHVGMDEVFLLGEPGCPRCKRIGKSALFAKQVNDLHKHLVTEKKLEMMMWGDRFLDGAATGYGEWEASMNNTYSAIDQVKKDIIICDWHYGQRGDYPSLKIFADKGFRVWPCGWNDATATELFAKQAKAMKSPKVLGHLVSTWGSVAVKDLPNWPPFVNAMAIWK
jgi:Glycosyl hydrolase family 20, catalytic domain